MDEFKRQLTEMHAFNTLQSNYQKTMLLLRALKAGTIGLDFITVLPDGWQLAEPTTAEPIQLHDPD